MKPVCKFEVVGENTGPNYVEWCSYCGAIRDGNKIDFPNLPREEDIPNCVPYEGVKNDI